MPAPSPKSLISSPSAPSEPAPESLLRNPLLIHSPGPEIPAAAARFLDLIAEPLAATEKLFHQRLDSDVPFIRRAGEYIFRGGGKRMRPALLLLSARMLNREGEEAVTYAAVVELIHTATLIHDDIIDHAVLRRGQRTINELWGNSLTVLLGDWLYTSAMEMALAHHNLPVLGRLCTATLRMTEGELLTLERLGSPELTVDEYFAIIDRKTARLFDAACSLPALIPQPQVEAEAVLSRYGRSLGVCFQLVDDLLDYTASVTELGKPVLSDLKEGKLTLPLLLARPRLAPHQRQKIAWVLEDRGFQRVAADEILELVHREGTLDEVSELAQSHAAEARAALETLPPGEARDALEMAPDLVLHRRS